ncbi:MAG: hypothetical protein AB8C13_01555 [Phycisphaerales bacterium]
MKTTAAALVAGACFAASAQAAVVNVGDSTASWLGFMNVSELPENGGGFVFGSGWGLGDLVTSFDDGVGTMTMSPNTIGDPNEFWYQDPTGMGNTSPGGPGAPGNKIMEANIFQEVGDGSLSGQTVTFEGEVLSNSYTDAHVGTIFIRDFAGDFSSFTETRIDVVAGAFSLSLDTSADAGRIVQWGFTTVGVNVWETDTAPFGSFTVSTIPTPSAMALLGMGGLVASRRRRA